MNQIALPLEINPASGEEGYLVTQCNVEVHEHLQNWTNWPNLTAILVGPQAAGKLAMAQEFEQQSGGRFVADAEKVADDELFHLWNRSKADGTALLLTSSCSIADWKVKLPDLKSRLAASLLLELGPPDEAMIEGLFQKYFSTRGLSISEEALSYLGKRMERSYRNVEILAQNMDVIAIERKKPITLAIARAGLSKLIGDGEKNG